MLKLHKYWIGLYVDNTLIIPTQKQTAHSSEIDFIDMVLNTPSIISQEVCALHLHVSDTNVDSLSQQEIQMIKELIAYWPINTIYKTNNKKEHNEFKV